MCLCVAHQQDSVHCSSDATGRYMGWPRRVPPTFSGAPTCLGPLLAHRDMPIRRQLCEPPATLGALHPVVHLLHSRPLLTAHRGCLRCRVTPNGPHGLSQLLGPLFPRRHAGQLGLNAPILLSSCLVGSPTGPGATGVLPYWLRTRSQGGGVLLRT